ncbi:MAG: hypothetical protein ACRD4S_13485 [Candidatus Acidiferrales bacterium]
MPRYISQHTLACLTRQGVEDLARRMQASANVTLRRVLVNMQEGKMLAELEAPGREDLEKYFTSENFHFDWILRVEMEFANDGLQPV